MSFDWFIDSSWSVDGSGKDVSVGDVGDVDVEAVEAVEADDDDGRRFSFSRSLIEFDDDDEEEVDRLDRELDGRWWLFPG